MRIEKLGEGNPEFAVVGSIHGDEPCGKMAIEKFLESDIEVLKPVKFVIANEKALKQNERYTEVDLNRSFPGDAESDKYEERLAAKLMDELEGLNILDMHSTKSSGDIFAAHSYLDEERMEMVRKTGAEIVSYHAESNVNSMDEYLNAVPVECGFQGSEQARKQAYEVLLNFLAANGIIDRDYDISDPDIFQIYGTVEKPEYRFTAENFKLVKKGDVYATNGEKELKAEERFYPVLMSTNGYDDILGRKAKKVEEPNF